MDWRHKLTLLVFVPILGMGLLWSCATGIGPGKVKWSDRPLPDSAALKRTLAPGTSHMEDATALLGWSRVEYGIIDTSGTFQPQQDATTGPAARRIWASRRAYVRGWGAFFGQQRVDERTIEMVFGPPDFTLRQLTDHTVTGAWGDWPFSH